MVFLWYMLLTYLFGHKDSFYVLVARKLDYSFKGTDPFEKKKL